MKALLITCFLSLHTYFSYSQIPYPIEKLKKITVVSYKSGSHGFFIHEIPYYLNGNLFITDSFKISNTYYFQTRENYKADYKNNRKTGKYRNVRGVFIKTANNQKHQVSELIKFKDTISYATIDTLLRKMNHPTDFVLRNAGITDDDIAAYSKRLKRHKSDSILLDTVKITFTKEMVLPLKVILDCQCLGLHASHGPRNNMKIVFTPESNQWDYVLGTSSCTFQYKTLVALLPILQQHLPAEFHNKTDYLSKKRILDLALGYLRKSHENDRCWISER